MRHHPMRVDRVAVEAAPELIVDAAAGHCVERVFDDAEVLRVTRAHVAAQQELRLIGGGNFGASPKPPFAAS